MPPPPPVSSTRTAMTLCPALSMPAGTSYARGTLYPTVAPTFTPLTQVVSMSSIMPSWSVAAAPAAPAGSSNARRNQTTPLRSGSPASSHSVGSAIVFHAAVSSAGSLHDFPAAEPASFGANHASSRAS